MRGLSFLFVFLLILLVLSPVISAVGISPPAYVVDFEPGLEQTFTHNVVNKKGEEIQVLINVTGPLAKYITVLNPDLMIPAGSAKPFSYTVHLPDELPPGRNKANIGVLDNTRRGGGMFGVKVGVIGKFIVNVPYPGRYAELSLSVPDIKEGQQVYYSVSIKNKGLENLTGNLRLRFSDGKDRDITVRYDGIGVDSGEELALDGPVDQLFPKGEYLASAVFDYGGVAAVNRTFRVGSYDISIINYSKVVYEGEISPVDVLVESNWNARIDSVYAVLGINGKSYRSLAKGVKPFGRAKLRVYVDDPDLAAGDSYDANITAYFGDKKASRVGRISVMARPVPESPAEIDLGIWGSATTYLVIAVIILIIFNLILIRKRR